MFARFMYIFARKKVTHRLILVAQSWTIIYIKRPNVNQVWEFPVTFDLFEHHLNINQIG